MSAPILRIIQGGRSDNTTGTELSTPTPEWWRRRVVRSLRLSLFRPWLWPVQLQLIRLRRQSIERALHTIRGEIGFDGAKDFDFVQAFINTEKERYNDPAFRNACEEALRIGRLTLCGQPVILNEEIRGRGPNTFLYHFGWVVARLSDPLPKNLAV